MNLRLLKTGKVEQQVQCFHLSLLESVRTQRAGVVISQVGFDIDDICACSTHPHHIEAFPGQIVAWDKRSFLAF